VSGCLCHRERDCRRATKSSPPARSSAPPPFPRSAGGAGQILIATTETVPRLPKAHLAGCEPVLDALTSLVAPRHTHLDRAVLPEYEGEEPWRLASRGQPVRLPLSRCDGTSRHSARRRPLRGKGAPSRLRWDGNPCPQRCPKMTKCDPAQRHPISPILDKYELSGLHGKTTEPKVGSSNLSRRATRIVSVDGNWSVLARGLGHVEVPSEYLTQEVCSARLDLRGGLCRRRLYRDRRRPRSAIGRPARRASCAESAVARSVTGR